jgi:hypothetical protein
MPGSSNPSKTTVAPRAFALAIRSGSSDGDASRTGTALLPLISSSKSFSRKPSRTSPMTNSDQCADAFAGSRCSSAFQNATDAAMSLTLKYVERTRMTASRLVPAMRQVCRKIDHPRLPSTTAPAAQSQIKGWDRPSRRGTLAVSNPSAWQSSIGSRRRVATIDRLRRARAVQRSSRAAPVGAAESA